MTTPQSYLIENEYFVGKSGDLDWTARIHNCASPMAAVQHAAQCYTWARGCIDRDAGVIYPFNPNMLVDGVPAYRVAAAEFGGQWAEAAARKDAALGVKVAA